TSAPDQLRGRLMAIYTLAFLVSMALGNVLTGWVARGGRVPFALGLNGVLMVLLILVGMVLRRRDWDRAEQA
ncbi:MAG TPA: MFS transporter, partial [bacterium]|nr:MFS transporter [bacterium]